MPVRPVGVSGSKNGVLYFVCLVFLFLLLAVALRTYPTYHPQPQPQLQRGVVIKTISDGKLYFVTAVTSEGADLAPCIGAGCAIQGWSAARLQETAHRDAYPGDPNYGDVMALFAKQPEPNAF